MPATDESTDITAGRAVAEDALTERARALPCALDRFRVDVREDQLTTPSAPSQPGPRWSRRVEDSDGSGSEGQEPTLEAGAGSGSLDHSSHVGTSTAIANEHLKLAYPMFGALVAKMRVALARNAAADD